MKRDKFGVPVVGAPDIERLAEAFLACFCPSVLDRPEFTPLMQILQELQGKLGLRVEPAARLGNSPEGHKYLGSFEPASRTIRIDESLTLTDDPRFSFTVAHELGHFVLHSDVNLEALDQGHTIIRDSGRDLVLNRVDSAKPRSMLEWQANRFAVGILLPRRTVSEAVRLVQSELGIIRNLGSIWIDASESSEVDFKETVRRLGALYQVSKAALRYRLDELGMLREFRSRSGGFESLSGVVANLTAEGPADDSA